MSTALQIFTLMLVALAMATALAHALEFPGKRRLSREAYLAMQPIYYPGFTVVGGFGEFGGMIATLVLVFLTPRGTISFWLTLGAFLCLLVMHLVYWVVTRPVNKFWLKDQRMAGAGAHFFSADPLKRSNDDAATQDWTALRDRWEYSHVARAALSLLSLLLLAMVIAR